MTTFLIIAAYPIGLIALLALLIAPAKVVERIWGWPAAEYFFYGWALTIGTTMWALQALSHGVP